MCFFRVRLISVSRLPLILFLGFLLFDPQISFGQDKQEIRCFWLGSSSSPPRLVKTFDDFINASKGFKTAASQRGPTVRLDRLAVADGNGKEKPIAFKGIKKGEIDFFIFQISSGFTRNPEAIAGMDTVLKEACEKARSMGGEPVFWASYAAQDDKESSMSTEDRQALLHKELIKLAAKYNALYVPAGSAWQEVRMEHKSDEMYMFSAIPPRDIGHTGPRGNFILGATIYAALTGENPAENPNLMTYEMDENAEKQQRWASSVPFPIAAEEAKHFKEVAWKHVLAAKTEYEALGGKFSHPKLGGTASNTAQVSSPAPTPAPVATQAPAGPDQAKHDIYLVMGRKSQIATAPTSSATAQGLWVLDNASGDWRAYQPAKDGDGGVGQKLVETSPGRSVGLIFCGDDKSTLSDWAKNKKCYNAAMTLAQNALREGTLKACIWLSGPDADDSKDPAFTKMVEDFCEEIPSVGLPFSTASDPAQIVQEILSAGKK